MNINEMIDFRSVPPLCLLLISQFSQALTLPLPEEGDVVGEVHEITTKASDTLSDIARFYDLGYNEITSANPQVNPWLPGEGTPVVIPSRFILPPGPREGIVINLAELRLYYYPAGGKEVVTHPLGIGREGWSTPVGLATVRKKRKYPAWYPPKSIIEEYAARGETLSTVVPHGPENPLGDYAIYLTMYGYLLHGTDKPYGVGMRVSHGCIRLYPEDIEQLFQKIEMGTRVKIINQPFKVGKSAGALYVEVHEQLQEQLDSDGDNLTPLMGAVVGMTDEGDIKLDWLKLREAASQKRGVPVQVSN